MLFFASVLAAAIAAAALAYGAYWWFAILSGIAIGLFAIAVWAKSKTVDATASVLEDVGRSGPA